MLCGAWSVSLAQSSRLDTSFAPTITQNGEISTIAIAPNGKVLIAGSFELINGKLRRAIARVNEDGSLDDYNPRLEGDDAVVVNQILVDKDGKTLISGSFSFVNGVERSHLARLNIDGSTDLTFAPKMDVGESFKVMILQPDNKMLLVGKFKPYPLDIVRRLNSDGSLDMSFSQHNAESRESGFGNALALQTDGKIILAGTYTTYGSNWYSKISRLLPDGSLDQSFVGIRTTNEKNAYASDYVSTVNALAVLADGKILIGGRFDTVNSVAHKFLARLQADGFPDADFNPVPDNEVTFMNVEPKGGILLGGYFGVIYGKARSQLCRLNIDGSLDEAFDPLLSIRCGRLFTSVQDSAGQVFIGGWVSGLTSSVESSVLKASPAGRVDAIFKSVRVEEGSRISTTALQADGSILLGGQFEGVNGNETYRLARLNPDGSLDTSFKASSSRLPVRIAVAPDNTIVFTTYNSIQRLLPDGSRDQRFTPPDNIFGSSPVARGQYCLLIQRDGKILAGSEEKPLFRLNVNGSTDSTFNAARFSSYRVHNAALDVDGTLLVSFGAKRDDGSPHFVRLLADGATDTDFAPPHFEMDVNCWFSPAWTLVYSLLIQPDRKILISGTFNTVNGVRRNGIARLNKNGTLDLSFDPGQGLITWTYGVGLPSVCEVPGVGALALLNDGRILVGGAFESVGGVKVGPIALLNANGSVEPDFETGRLTSGTRYAGEFYAGPSIETIIVQADGKLLVHGNFVSIDGLLRTELARFLPVLRPERLTGSVRDGLMFKFSFENQIGHNYRLQVSGDLRNWIDMTNFMSTSSLLSFSDYIIEGSGGRFYRVISP